MWSTAVYDLKLTDEAFWNMTPVEFDYIMKRYILEEERFDRRAALIGYLMVSVWGSAKSKKYKIDDFMLHDYGSKAEKKENWKESLQTLRQQIGKTKGG